MSHDPLGESDNPLTEIAYQISCIAYIYIMIYSSKITVMKLLKEFYQEHSVIPTFLLTKIAFKFSR